MNSDWDATHGGNVKNRPRKGPSYHKLKPWTPPLTPYASKSIQTADQLYGFELR
jgi:hypothetical protein